MSEFTHLSSNQNYSGEKIRAILTQGSELCTEIEAYRALCEDVAELVDKLSRVFSMQDALKVTAAIYDLPLPLLRSMIPEAEAN